jgi:hypothetical protein
MTTARKSPSPEETEAYVLSVLQQTIPGLTLEKFREGHARFKQQEAIRKQEIAARRKARKAAKEQGT